MTKCELVHITATAEADGNTVTLTVPAFTVTQDELRTRVMLVLDTYLASSRILDEPMSLGDFALYALGHASTDPKEMP